MADDTQDFIKALQQAPNTDMPFGVDQPKPVKQMADLLANKATQIATIPQRAMEASGEDLQRLGDPTRTSLNTTGPALETAQMMMGVGAPMAEAGSAGLFGGRLAAGADKAMLQRANHLEGMSVNPERIHRETNWYRDPADQQWKFEIPDDRMELNYFPATEGNMQSVTLGHVVDHPEFFKNYPDMAKTKLHLTMDKSEPQGFGSYDTNTGDIYVNAPDIKAARSILAHEMQHGIQAKEGTFAYGSDPDWLQAMMAQGFQTKPDLAKGMNKQEMLDNAYWLYWKHAGEVEARNVQNRLDWSTGRRKLLMPTQSQSIPLRDQIYYNPMNNTIRALKGQ